MGRLSSSRLAGRPASGERARDERPRLLARLGNSDASFVLPAVIFMAALVIFPTLYAVFVSLTNWNLTDGTPRTFAGASNYTDFLHDHRFWAALTRTLVFAAVSTVMTLILGMGLAIVLNRPLPGKSLFRTMLIVPMVMTPVVVGLTWRFMYSPDLGMVNWFLGLFDIGPIAFLGRTDTALASVIITDVWEYTPFALLILLAGLESLPPEPFEAAQIDGASALRTFWHITLPMMKGPLAVALLFRVMFSFNVFDTLYVMTGGGPGRSSETLVMYAFKLGFGDWEIGKSAAAALIALVLITVLARGIVRMVQVKGS